MPHRVLTLDPRPRRLPVVAIVLATFLAAGCAAPMTRTGAVSQDLVLSEQQKEQQLALRALLDQQRRLDSVAFPLLRSAVPFCGANTALRTGLRLGSVYTFKREWKEAARSIGLGDTITIFGVAPGSGAARAELRPGDRVLRIGGTEFTPGSGALPAMLASVQDVARSSTKATQLAFVRNGHTESASVALDTVCAYTVTAVEADELNAFSDGQSVFVTSAMLRFVTDDELSIVLSHEIAHNAMHHIDAKKKNTLLGGLLGAVVDIAAAAGGVNTGGEFTKQGAQAGALVFSQDFEREADYVGLYIMALAGRPVDHAADFWRRMAMVNPKAIRFAYTHPTTAERAVRLEQWAAEVDRKVASSDPVRPEMKPGVILAAASWRPPPGSAVVMGLQGGEIAASRRASPLEHDAPPKPGQPVRQPLATASASSVAQEPAATAVIGAPLSEADRSAAKQVFSNGDIYMTRHEWGRAEASFRAALRLDGSVATYHAALGQVLLVEERWAEAEASLSAAVLLDPGNTEYHRLLAEARGRR